MGRLDGAGAIQASGDASTTLASAGIGVRLVLRDALSGKPELEYGTPGMVSVTWTVGQHPKGFGVTKVGLDLGVNAGTLSKGRVGQVSTPIKPVPGLCKGSLCRPSP